MKVISSLAAAGVTLVGCTPGGGQSSNTTNNSSAVPPLTVTGISTVEVVVDQQPCWKVSGGNLQGPLTICQSYLMMGPQAIEDYVCSVGKNPDPVVEFNTQPYHTDADEVLKVSADGLSAYFYPCDGNGLNVMSLKQALELYIFVLPGSISQNQSYLKPENPIPISMGQRGLTRVGEEKRIPSIEERRVA